MAPGLLGTAIATEAVPAALVGIESARIDVAEAKSTSMLTLSPKMSLPVPGEFVRMHRPSDEAGALLHSSRKQGAPIFGTQFPVSVCAPRHPGVPAPYDVS